MTTIRTVAINGAGQKGSGIAQAIAAGGYSVILYDAVAERVPQAQAAIAASLARQVERGLIDAAAADAAQSRISAASSLADAAKADLVIEAAVEDETIKKTLLAELAQNHDAFVTLEDGAVMGGAGSAVGEALQRLGLLKPLLALGLPDRFIEQGTQEEMYKELGLDSEGIRQRILDWRSAAI